MMRQPLQSATPGYRSPHIENPRETGARHSAAAHAERRWRVPELTRNADIKLNNGL
jgi:hypothetical protein